MSNETGQPVVVVKKDSGVAIVKMNRPDKLNAFSPELQDALIEALTDVKNDKTIRAVIITGEGKSFSAGGDLSTDIAPLADASPSAFNAYVDHNLGIYAIVHDMEKPVIAAINGYAVGAGLELAVSCDIRIAADNAKMGEVFVKLGLMPEVGIWLLPRLVGLGKARLLVMTGDLLGAREAEGMGLVDVVVPSDKLMSEAEELATRLARGPVAVGIIKKAINESMTMSFEASLHYTGRMQYHLVHTEDHKEAVSAWLAKRTPEFKGR